MHSLETYFCTLNPDRQRYYCKSYFFLNILGKLPITELMAERFPVVRHLGRLNPIENIFTLNSNPCSSLEKAKTIEN